MINFRPISSQQTSGLSQKKIVQAVNYIAAPSGKVKQAILIDNAPIEGGAPTLGEKIKNNYPKIWDYGNILDRLFNKK